MSTLRALLPQRDTNYTGKAEAEVVDVAGPMLQIMKPIMQEIMTEVDQDERRKCR